MKTKKISFFLGAWIIFSGIPSTAHLCELGLSLSPNRIGVEYDVSYDPSNLSGPDISIAGPDNLLTVDGEEVNLTVNGSDADGDGLFYFWRREGSCELSTDPCDTNADYTQVKVTVFGGIDSSCIVTAYANDGRGKQDTSRVSFKQDNDGDGVPNPDDAFPDDPSEWQDSDGDGIGDNADADDDNDGIPDDADQCNMINVGQFDLNGDGCQDQIADLVAYLDSLNLPKGIARSLRVKLEHADKRCHEGNMKNTQNHLNSFINEVEAQSGKKIPEDAASLMLQWADGLIQASQETNLDKDQDGLIDICEQTVEVTEEAEADFGGGCSLRIP